MTARRRQQQQATAAREDELAAGHAELRMAGFVAASAVDDDALDRQEELSDWLMRQQFKERHPYTGASPGGWGWTDLPGGSRPPGPRKHSRRG